ncbi:SRPBCC family protein [Streptomyces erythrochromogenes]|uniref:SRPBCC family protein n=1 Tax=Streptomyces erythrochromogenes TaxID=285574 RepID=A0ABZ1Q7T3_9ACTN|nr:SRPBCC family protein [Streptomyces erythrochromogenes]MCX5582442.1 SRPBCC family protein [Streptomyces erythrochromogenes]
MSAIRESIEIDRSPEEVFSYVSDASHLPEWQKSAVSVRGSEHPAVGSLIAVRRRIGRREFPTTMELTEYDPPRSWHLHGIDGPVRGDVRGTVEPLGDGTRSRLTLSLDFEGHGIGRVLVPLVVKPYARKEMPLNEEKLKHLIET